MNNSIFSNFHGQLLVGFSGGADSTALLLMAANGAAAGKCGVTAVHFNHHLRGAESDAEALAAENFARGLGVKFLKIDLDIAPGCNLEARARQARLEKWKELCAGYENPVVLLGHHLDDAIENLFIRIGRGSNVSGLTGMQMYSRIEGVKFFRPLMIYTRSEIEEFLKKNGVNSWAVDSSNLSCDYTRNVLRNRILPELYKLFPGGKDAVAATLTNLQYDAACLDSMAEFYYEQGGKERYEVIFWQRHERAVVVRMLRMLCREFFDDDTSPSAASVEHFSAMISAGNDGICELDRRRQLRISGGVIMPVENIPDKVSWNWREKHSVFWGKWHFKVTELEKLPEKISLNEACFCAAELPEILEIGSPEPGEKMLPFGRKSAVKVKELRVKRKVAAYPVNPSLRIPGGCTLWLPGIHHSGECPALPGKAVLMISAEKIEDFRVETCKKHTSVI